MSEQTAEEDGRERGRSLHRWLIPAAVVLIGGGLYVAVRTLPVKDYLLDFMKWTQQIKQQHLLLASAAFVLSYVAATVFMLPGSVLTLGAGFLFGLLGGTVLVSIASTLGACASFLIGRTVARGWVDRRVAGNPKFEAIDEAVGRQGFKIVLLVRLSPVFPFNLQNYGFGLTKVDFWKYALASWAGMIPGTVMYVYFGAGLNSLVQAAAGQAERTTAQRVAFWVGLAVAIFVAVYVARIARNALNKAVEQTEAGREAIEEGQ